MIGAQGRRIRIVPRERDDATPGQESEGPKPTAPPDGGDAAEGRDSRIAVRTWLRLLACSTLIENEIRSRLREQFNSTLPRFDLLAQLDKAEDGLVLVRRQHS